MKTKILLFTIMTMVAVALAGCGRPATENATPAANPPGDQQASSPAHWNNTNGPAVTNWPGTNNPTATNQ